MALYDKEQYIREMNNIGYIEADGSIKLDYEKAKKWSGDYRKGKCIECKYYPLCNGVQCPYAVGFKGVTNCHAGKMNFFKILIEKQIEMKVKKGEGMVL